MTGPSIPVDFIHNGEHRSVFVTVEYDENKKPFMHAETTYGANFAFVYRLEPGNKLSFVYRNKDKGDSYLDSLGQAFVNAFLLNNL